MTGRRGIGLALVLGLLLVVTVDRSAAGGKSHTVTITSGPSGTVASTDATFTYTSSQTASFTCSLDGKTPSACGSGLRGSVSYSGLALGAHRFSVFATVGGRAPHTARADRAWTVAKPPGPPPPDSSCPTNTICFDDLAPGSAVQSQYKGYGIVLGLNQSDPSGTAGVLPNIVAAAGAHSDGQMARIPACGKEFCSSTIYAKLDHAVHHVQVYAGGGSKVSLVGLNAAGVEVAQTSKSTGSGAQTLLAITTLVPQIVYLQIGQDAPPGEQYGFVNLDDLKFDPPDPSLQPDFALNWLPVAPGLPLGVDAGGSTTTIVYLTRFNGSTGNIVFSLDSASVPSGISAKFSPTTVYDVSTVKTTLTVTASLNAAVPPNAKLKVIGHPTSSSAGPANRTVLIPLDVRLSNYDLSVTGIEVNQGVQTQLEPYYDSAGKFSPTRCKLLPSLPVRDWTNLSKPVPYETFKEEPVFPESPVSQLFGDSLTSSDMTYLRRYGGVELVAGRKTVARVFATVRTPFGGQVANVPAVLYGSLNGKALPGSPLSPDDGDRTLLYSELPWTTCSQRANPKGAYTFTLPDSWAHGKIKLTAALIPQQIIFGPGAECGSATCAANNLLTLSEVEFNQLSYITVTPVRLTFYLNNKQVNPPDPVKVFDLARYLTPGTVYFGKYSGDTWYAGVIDISDDVFDSDLSDPKKLCSELLDELEDWADDNQHGDETVGVFVSSGAVCPGTSNGESHLIDDHEAFSVVAANRPLTSVAHEMFHGMGRVHADTVCGGNSDGQVGENWPPDQRGQIHGIGLDTHAGSGGGNGPYRVLVPGSLVKDNPYNEPGELIDFMSYCWGQDPGNVWISDGGWNATLDGLVKFQKQMGRLSPSRARATDTSLRVTAIVSASGVRMLTVKPANGRKVDGIPSVYRLVVRGGAGQAISDTPMRAAAAHTHGGPSPVLLKAEVPAAGAVGLEIVAGGKVVARRLRSGNAPQITILAPRAGARIGKGSSVVVRWRATDADGGKLEAKVDYSTGGGRWREIYSGASHDEAVLPSQLFAGSRRARVRVRVSDGFVETAAVSNIFTAVGRPPAVRIVSPAPRQRVLSDAQLYLEGSVYDDTGTRLRGSRLQWFAGARRLGRGSPLSVTGLPAGTRVIRLVATDAHSRRGQASVPVRLVAAAPHLLSLRVAPRLKPSATQLVLRLATTVAARLTAAGSTFQVDRKLRRIVLRIQPGNKNLRLHLRLTAGGRSTGVTLVVRRH